jgi:hypothetical protein
MAATMALRILHAVQASRDISTGLPPAVCERRARQAGDESTAAATTGASLCRGLALRAQNFENSEAVTPSR